jgi:hypothetical protein
LSRAREDGDQTLQQREKSDKVGGVLLHGDRHVFGRKNVIVFLLGKE